MGALSFLAILARQNVNEKLDGARQGSIVLAILPTRA